MHRMFNTKSEPSVSYGPWVIMMCQCRLTNVASADDVNKETKAKEYGENLWNFLSIRWLLKKKKKKSCIAESLCSAPEMVTALLMGYTPIQNKKLNK